MASAQLRLKARKKKPKVLLHYENLLKGQGFNFIIGVDEAGRGPLAGPVVAAAVALKTTAFTNRIDDSKKLSPISRDKAFEEITRKSSFGIGVVNEKVIDRINILEATRKAMCDAVSSLINNLGNLKGLKIHIIVDGNMPLKLHWPSTSIIKGDAKSISIAAASILAKVKRDNIMQEYDSVYPQYHFSKNKGYPTFEHRQIIKKIGLSAIHRKSFSCV